MAQSAQLSQWAVRCKSGSNFTIVTWAPGLFSHFADQGPHWAPAELGSAVSAVWCHNTGQARHPGMLSALSKRLGVCHTLIWLSANNRAGVWSWKLWPESHGTRVSVKTPVTRHAMMSPLTPWPLQCTTNNKTTFSHRPRVSHSEWAGSHLAPC